MPRIFISYRRTDSATIVGRIYDHLLTTFGEENVFKDVDDIPVGVNFKTYLQNAITECDVLLVIMGKVWASVVNEEGNRRLDDPNDFVRIEVESALNRPEMLVVPVLVQGASMPEREELPASLHDLRLRNAAIVRDDPDFRRDISRLIEQLRQATRQPQSERREISQYTPMREKSGRIIRRRRLVGGLAFFTLGVLIIGAWLLLNRSQPPSDTTPTLVSFGNLAATATPAPTEPPITRTPLPTDTDAPPTLTPTPRPTATPALPEGEAQLQFAFRQSNSYRPNSVDLQPFMMLANATLPTLVGAQPLYGLLTLGEGQEVAVVYDPSQADGGLLYVDSDLDYDLAEEMPVTLTDAGNESEVVTLHLTYGGSVEDYQLTFYYSKRLNDDERVFRLTYYPQSWRAGVIRLGNRNYAVALDDGDVNGRFDDAESYFLSDYLALDRNGDGEFYDSDDLIVGLTHALELNEVCYRVASVSAAGDDLRLERVDQGIVRGRITDRATGGGIGGAQIELQGARAVSRADGSYQLSVCPGMYYEALITREGYAPREIGLGELPAFTVRLDDPFTLDADMQAVSGVAAGEVTLTDGESYHFLTGERGAYTGGEFYVYIEGSSVEFYANNDQRGVVSLGDLGDADLYEVSFCSVRESDYTRFGVTAVEGHTYVALARAGEEGNYVAFRVTSIGAGSVTLEYVYRDYC
jgi:hypothetical protein